MQISEDQMQYAANDVLHLHRLKAKLDEMLVREGRQSLAQAAFDFLPARARNWIYWDGMASIFSRTVPLRNKD